MFPFQLLICYIRLIYIKSTLFSTLVQFLHFLRILLNLSFFYRKLFGLFIHSYHFRYLSILLQLFLIFDIFLHFAWNPHFLLLRQLFFIYTRMQHLHQFIFTLIKLIFFDILDILLCLVLPHLIRLNTEPSRNLLL